MATLFFKMKYPLAKILCFEPDPNAFLILKKNIAANRLKNVTALNVALSDTAGFLEFYGEIFGLEPDSRGSSLIGLWGEQRKTTVKSLVKSVQLSAYIDKEVDFLKLDIEAAEQKVLKELGQKLQWINRITLEVHEAKDLQYFNCPATIREILEQQGFNLQIIQQDITGLLPEQVQSWADRVEPKFYIYKAEKPGSL
jgi:FkbM family methyltransferase